MKHIHRISTATMGLLVLTAGPAMGANNKVDICHVQGNDDVHMIEVSENALDTHLDHGDYLPIAFFSDDDGDGFGDASDSATDCEAPAGYVEDATDCDDGNPSIHPGAEEQCDDGIDHDCDGEVDEDCLGECGFFYPDDGGEAEAFGNPYTMYDEDGVLVLCAGEYDIAHVYNTTGTHLRVVGAGSDATTIDGSVWGYGGSVSVTGVTITNARAWNHTAAFYANYRGEPMALSLVDVVIDDSKAGIVVNGDSADTDNVFITLEDVTVRGCDGDVARALYLQSASSSMTDVVIEDNTNPRQRATVQLTSGTHELTDCSIQGNLAEGYASSVLWVLGSDVTMTRCDISGNDLISDYASVVAAIGYSGSLTLYDSSISTNVLDWPADAVGQPVAVSLGWNGNGSSTFTVSNTEITDNEDVFGEDMDGVYCAAAYTHFSAEELGSSFTCDTHSGCSPTP